MPTAEAHVQSEHPGRYLIQLCRHADNINHKGRHFALHSGEVGEKVRPPTAGAAWIGRPIPIVQRQVRIDLADQLLHPVDELPVSRHEPRSAVHVHATDVSVLVDILLLVPVRHPVAVELGGVQGSDRGNQPITLALDSPSCTGHTRRACGR
jgi:hypothetical protein